jgi:ABC-type branched-subunit amino acid transport system substrate-binding protein
MVAEAIRKGGNTSVGIKEALLSIVDYPGVMGKISVAPNGDAKFPVRVVKLAGGRIVEVE